MQIKCICNIFFIYSNGVYKKRKIYHNKVYNNIEYVFLLSFYR
jgi:hypothetical protein